MRSECIGFRSVYICPETPRSPQLADPTWGWSVCRTLQDTDFKIANCATANCETANCAIASSATANCATVNCATATGVTANCATANSATANYATYDNLFQCFKIIVCTTFTTRAAPGAGNIWRKLLRFLYTPQLVDNRIGAQTILIGHCARLTNKGYTPVF